MNDAMWFDRSFRRGLVDMHIPDWDPAFMRDFSAETYAECMALAGFDTVEIYAGNCLGLQFWPTQTGFRHRQLHGRDLVGETVAACRKRGLGVVLYLNMWHRAAYDAHPEWRVIHPDGLGSVDSFHYRFGICCLNSGFGEFFLRLLDELNASYDCLGIWIDMIGWLHSICYCPHCRARFERETGAAELPRTVDWDDPVWLAFQQARVRWLAEYADRVVQTVKRRTPERSVALQKAGMLTGWVGATGLEFLYSGDYSAGDFTGDPIEQSCVSKLLALFSGDHALEFMTPRCENLEHHTTERDSAQLLLRGYAAMAHQAAFTLIDAIDPEGTLDPDFYRRAGVINANLAPYDLHRTGRGRPIADIGIYFSADSQRGRRPDPYPATQRETLDERSNPHWQGWRNLARICRAGHRQYGFATADTPLEEFPLLILSDCGCLSDRECERLTDYVARGGRLYASRTTSLYDPERGECADFKLARVFGIHRRREPIRSIGYLAGTGHPLFDPGKSVMLDQALVPIAADADTEILATLGLPWSTPEELNCFGSAISNPLREVTAEPALTRHRFGHGEAIYCAGNWEAHPCDWHRERFERLLQRWLPVRRLETDLPGTVEITAFEHREERRTVLHLLNSPAEPPIPEYADTTLAWRAPEHGKPERIRWIAPEYAGRELGRRVMPVHEAELPFTYADGVTRFQLPPLGAYAMVMLQY